MFPVLVSFRILGAKLRPPSTRVDQKEEVFFRRVVALCASSSRVSFPFRAKGRRSFLPFFLPKIQNCLPATSQLKSTTITRNQKSKGTRNGWAYSLIYIWSGLPRGNYYRFAEKHGSLGSTRSCCIPTRDASGFQRQKVPLDRIATMIRQNWCARAAFG